MAYTKETPLKDAQGAVVAIIAKGVTSDWYIDDFSVNEIPPCARPEYVKVTGVTDKSITFDWTMYQESGLEVYDGDRLLGTLSGNSRTLTDGITPDTELTLGSRLRAAVRGHSMRLRCARPVPRSVCLWSRYLRAMLCLHAG